ncbi:MAG: sigma-70 family RNA polymerase sigma factor [Clostridia bacterium]|nr:sigma-70 family RNA polymerase sigma factor [Clostridia bacterium]
MRLQKIPNAEEPMSDEQILAMYLMRDEDAIRQTDIKYGKYLMAIAINIVHDFYDAEECLNDTYIGAWNSIPSARPLALQAFLATIMRRTALNRYKANMRDKRIVSEFTESLADFEYLIEDDGTLDGELRARELGKLISNYVRGLSERRMYIFISRYYFAYPIATIAQKLGVSRSTVNKEIAFIKNNLKDKLKGDGYWT